MTERGICRYIFSQRVIKITFILSSFVFVKIHTDIINYVILAHYYSDPVWEMR